MTNNQLTDKRARLRKAAQDYQSTLSWYQENPDSPNAEQDCDEARAALKREIGHQETDIIADLLDEIGELQERCEHAEKPQQRRKADELSLQTAPALYSLSKTGEVRCSNSPVIPDGYCIMPVTLTAENGAKRALSGEFSIPRSVTCPECGGDGCSDCDGRGDWNEDQIIDWPTIKLIYQKAVEACAIAATQKQDKSA